MTSRGGVDRNGIHAPFWELTGTPMYCMSATFQELYMSFPLKSSQQPHEDDTMIISILGVRKRGF